MTTHIELQRDLGRVEGRLGAMEDRLDKIDGVLERIDSRLARIEAAESQQRGGLTVATWIAGALGALIVVVLNHFWKA